MTKPPREALEIRSRARAARDEVVHRLQATNQTYRRSEVDRRDLMVAAADFGLSIRQIAELIGENPSSVAFWIKRAREADPLEQRADGSVPGSADLRSQGPRSNSRSA